MALEFDNLEEKKKKKTHFQLQVWICLVVVVPMYTPCQVL